jgi:hypothetical protein
MLNEVEKNNLDLICNNNKNILIGIELFNEILKTLSPN